jgi:signal transduction histidine kinase
VRVSLRVDDGRLIVRVSDNGRGFDVDAVRESAAARFGLETMRERAESIGGVLEIISSPGNGTTIALTVPVPPQAARAAGEV